MDSGNKDERPMPVEIDDPEDLENAIIRALVRRGPHFRIGMKSYVVAQGLLPQRWLTQTQKFSSLKDAIIFIDQAERGGLSVAVQRQLAAKLITPQTKRVEVKVLIAAELFRGDLWVILRNASVDKGKADATVYAAINGQFGTRIDFNFLAQWEGGQYLHGYVPFSRGMVAGNSGVTIATGFDIGQKSANELGALGLDLAILAKIAPFASLKFGGNTRQQVIDKIAALKTLVPTVTKAQADKIDQIIHADILSGAVGSWNRSKNIGVPSFAQLPQTWQTVLCSRFFHQGKYAAGTSTIKKFWTSATSGNWETAVSDLENYPVSASWYKARVRKEAAYLRTLMPLPIPTPIVQALPGRPLPAKPGKH